MGPKLYTMPGLEVLWLADSGEFFPGSLGLLNVHLKLWTEEPGMSLRSKAVLEFRPCCSMIYCTESMGFHCEEHHLELELTVCMQPSNKVKPATKWASILTWRPRDIQNSTLQFSFPLCAISACFADTAGHYTIRLKDCLLWSSKNYVWSLEFVWDH